MSSTLPPIPWDKPQTSYEWVDWYTKLRNVIDTSALNHNSLQGLQGGAPNDYYHLTSVNAAKVPNAEQTTAKDTASGYAGLNANSRTTKGVDTVDDVIFDNVLKGPVLKSANGHFWRATISNAGVVTWTDLGTTKP